MKNKELLENVKHFTKARPFSIHKTEIGAEALKTVKFLMKTGLYCLLPLPMTATLNVTANSQPSQMEL